MFSFDVIDNDRVFPGEKLRRCVQAFAVPGRSNDNDVAKLTPVWGGRHGQHLIVWSNADEKMRAPFRLSAVHEAGELMRIGEAGFVNSGIRSGKERGAGEPPQDDACGQYQIGKGLRRGYTSSTSLPIVRSSFVL